MPEALVKALTICQPYAHLILLPITDPRHKRVENREWATTYRGPMYLHAGKSRAWMSLERGDDGRPWDANYEIYEAEMVFGAMVGTVILIDCLPIARIEAGHYDKQYPWLCSHQHTSGPWCWILKDPVTLARPVPWKGKQGLWEAEECEVIAASESMFHAPGKTS